MMDFLTASDKLRIIDFFEQQAAFIVDRKIPQEIGLSEYDFYKEVIGALRNMLNEAISKGLVPPVANLSNIIPCAIVIPEEAMSINDQYTKLGLDKTKSPRIESRIKFDYYRREALLMPGTWPYLAVAISVTSAPPTKTGYLGDINVALGRDNIMMGLDGLLAVLTLHGLHSQMMPWKNNTGRGDVALGASVKEDGDRITYPTVEFENGWAILIKHFTSDKTRKVSPNHRFLTCGGRFRIQG